MQKARKPQENNNARSSNRTFLPVDARHRIGRRGLAIATDAKKNVDSRDSGSFPSGPIEIYTEEKKAARRGGRGRGAKGSLRREATEYNRRGDLFVKNARYTPRA